MKDSAELTKILKRKVDYRIFLGLMLGRNL